MENVVITGGAGFIGSHLASRLVSEGFNVTVYDILQLDYGKLENLKHISSCIRFIRGDIRDFNVVVQALKGADVVFHLSAISHLPVCKDNPLTAVEVNVGGTLNVLESSRLNGVRRVLFAGSDHIYGDAQYIPIDEIHPYNPKDTYSLSKVQAIELCKLYRESYGLDTRVLVSGNAIGERQDISKVTPTFIERALNNLPFVINGGNQTRGFYHVDNLVEAYLILAKADNMVESVYNVDGSQEITIRDYAEKIISMTGSRSELSVLPYRYDEDKATRLFLDTTRIMNLGYKEVVGLDEGLKRTIEWHREA